MIDTLTVESFKSLESVTVELGNVNVFIGANGSGKSNLLEALGVLSAAANGRVDDEALLYRGVRPGVPKLYKTSFPSRKRQPAHISFAARNSQAQYKVSLHNPLTDPKPAWRFKTELWQKGNEKLVGSSPALRKKANPEQGLAALKAVECNENDPALQLLRELQGYQIFAPTTPVLRGIANEPQPRKPVGLSGGQLPGALGELFLSRHKNPHAKQICSDAIGLIDWATSFLPVPAAMIPLSPAAAASQRVVRFTDRYMLPGRNVLSGYDASEGALVVLFLAVLAGHDLSPALCAVDNADHGLNPRLARALMGKLCDWYLNAPQQRQILLTTHNPLVLDGLPLQDDRVRLFTVSRTNTGRTAVRRVEVDEALLAKAEEGWTLSRLWVMGHLGGVPDV
ncbi:MAG: AAA family ATPase [Candidatus Nealsonbacteria bacterium]|nr:AAA family ATPase [Candidatus Nealsonbacteria bacterium]